MKKLKKFISPKVKIHALETRTSMLQASGGSTPGKEEGNENPAKSSLDTQSYWYDNNK